jgi:DNA-binding response OmpR family regulator
MATLLIVDDDPTARLVIMGILEEEGHRVITATDGAEARALLERDHATIDAVVLDWILPETSGIDLLRWMKRFATMAQIPVIMQTVLTTPERVKEGIDAGAFYFLNKPVDAHILQAIVKAAVSDREYKTLLLRQLAECQNPLASMTEGEFRFRTQREGERLALAIANASPQPAKAMGISEIFLNAVEHGNLGITYDGKTELLDKGIWAAEVERRLALPENAGKYVVVRVANTPGEMTVLVRDCGQGFDFERYLHFDATRVFHTHGRGIAIASSDLQLGYLGNGSSVLITISAAPPVA